MGDKASLLSPTQLAAGVPPAWVESSDAAAQDIAAIREKMAELARRHAHALLVSFDDMDDDGGTIEVLTQDVTRLFKRAEMRLKKVGDGASAGDPVENKVRRNVQMARAQELQGLSVDFRKQQRAYLQKLKAQEQGAKKVGGTAGAAMDLIGDEEGGAVDMGWTEGQMNRLKQAEGMSMEREKEIVKIVESIQELAQVMKDLSVLVVEQGELIDKIDYNITAANTSVQAGHAELVKAEDTQKRGWGLYCILALVACIAIVVIVIIVRMS